jgi:hypothetical protein
MLEPNAIATLIANEKEFYAISWMSPSHYVATVLVSAMATELKINTQLFDFADVLGMSILTIPTQAQSLQVIRRIYNSNRSL